MKSNHWTFAVLLWSCFLTSAWAVEIRVDPGTGTLAAAIAAASDGDTLVLGKR